MELVASWFKFAENLGESMRIVSAKIRADGTPEWEVIDHCEMDGIGAISQYLKGSTELAPQAKHLQHTKPSNLKILLALLSHLRSRSVRIRWKKYDPTRVGVSPAIAWTSFNIDTTNVLKKLAYDQGVSLTSLLLLAFDRSVRKQFTQGETTRWSIPVNMRGLTQPASAQNQVSFLNINLGASNTAQDVHTQIKKKFREGNHWASWTLMHIASILGLKRTEELYRKRYQNPNPETGTFSNLGEWMSERIAPDQAFITAAPTSKLTPVTLAIIIVNGKLSAVAQIHPSLLPVKEEIEQLLRQWLLELEADSSLPLNSQAIQLGCPSLNLQT